MAHLRSSGALAGRSKPDLWIAAWAAEHSAPLATRSVKHFESVPDVRLIGY